MHSRKDGENTRHKIIDAACEVFGAKGYHAATHAEICRKAGVNTAAINFHFGSKENLYRETWEHLVARIERLCPLDGGIPATAKATRRLRGLSRTMLMFAMDPRFVLGRRILTAEWLCPSGLIGDQVGVKNRMVMDYSEGLVRELLGPEASERDVAACQMFFMTLWKGVSMSVADCPDDPSRCFSMTDIDDLATSMMEVCLNWIRQRRRRIGHRQSLTRSSTACPSPKNPS